MVFFLVVQNHSLMKVSNILLRIVVQQYKIEKRTKRFDVRSITKSSRSGRLIQREDSYYLSMTYALFLRP